MLQMGKQQLQDVCRRSYSFFKSIDDNWCNMKITIIRQ